MVNHFWQSVDAVLEDASVIETIVDLLDAKLLIQRLSSFCVPGVPLIYHCMLSSLTRHFHFSPKTLT